MIFHSARQADELRRQLADCKTILVAAQIDRDHAQGEVADLRARLDLSHAAEIQLVNSLRTESTARLKAETELEALKARVFDLREHTIAPLTARLAEAETRYHDLIKQAMAPVPAVVLPTQPDFEQRADKAVNTQGRKVSDQTVERMIDHIMRTSGADKETAAAEVAALLSTDTLTADESGLMGFLHDATVSTDPEDYPTEPTGHEAMIDAEQES